MPPRWFEQWRGFWPPAELFAAASIEIGKTELFPSDSFRVKQQGLAILYHLIILKSLGCLTFPPGWRRCRWFQATNFCPFGSGQKSRLETRDSSRDFTLHLSSFIAKTINGWFCGCVGLSCTRNLTRRSVGAWWFETVIAEQNGTRFSLQKY